MWMQLNFICIARIHIWKALLHRLQHEIDLLLVGQRQKAPRIMQVSSAKKNDCTDSLVEKCCVCLEIPIFGSNSLRYHYRSTYDELGLVQECWLRHGNSISFSLN
jgi:hypothetical protein